MFFRTSDIQCNIFSVSVLYILLVADAVSWHSSLYVGPIRFVVERADIDGAWDYGAINLG